MSRRAALAATLAAAFAFRPAPAAAATTMATLAEAGALAPAAAAAAAAGAAAATDATTVYFGSGCFWGRQHDFVEAEKNKLKREPGAITAVTGYAGGLGGADAKGRVRKRGGAVGTRRPRGLERQSSWLALERGRAACAAAASGGRSPSTCALSLPRPPTTHLSLLHQVCYYYANDSSVYEKRGHAEVVRVALAAPGDDAGAAASMKALSEVFFGQFVKTDRGMARQDPQDAGAGYRNVVGLPGGVKSPLYKILRDANTVGMDLVEGKGGGFEKGRPTEDDTLNKVWILDSNALPFYPAEAWHQYHDGVGYGFPAAYKKEMKRAATDAGLVPAAGKTGCPEFPFL
jgi:peptide methionine sulfoxide reductase MsrA